MNLTKSEHTSVDLEAKWYKDQLFVKFTRHDKDLGDTHFSMAFDDIDLEHFISNLILLQR